MGMSKAAMILLSMGMGIIANHAPRPAEAIARNVVANSQTMKSRLFSKYNIPFYGNLLIRTSFTRSTKQTKNSRNAIKKHKQKEANKFRIVWGYADDGKYRYRELKC